MLYQKYGIMIYKKILIAVDSRENSMTVAQKGFELSEQLNAEAGLIFVVDISMAIGNPDAGILHNDALIILKKEAQDSLDQLIRMNNRSIDTIKFMPEGLPRESILKTAETWDADLIVMGLHGKSGFGIFIMGSISQYISLHSKIPVIIIPPEKK